MVRPVLAGVVGLLLLTGCAGRFPADPEGTLDRVEGGVLRVGVSAHSPWTEVAPDGAPTGLEVDLVTEFAESLDADVEWTASGEEDLMAQLDRSELDLVIGGLTAASPWAEHSALTYPYTTVPGADGAPQAHVMAAPMGENAFLVALETFLLEHKDVQP